MFANLTFMKLVLPLPSMSRVRVQEVASRVQVRVPPCGTRVYGLEYRASGLESVLEYESWARVLPLCYLLTAWPECKGPRNRMTAVTVPTLGCLISPLFLMFLD